MGTPVKQSRQLLSLAKSIVSSQNRRQSSQAMERLLDDTEKFTNKLNSAGIWRPEFYITGHHGTALKHNDGKNLVNFRNNDYLNLDHNPEILGTHIAALKSGGQVGSYRQLAGTWELHKTLERRIADFHEREDALVYPSCGVGNWGIFQALYKQNDAIFSDEHNHATLIDGINYSKATNYLYDHRNMNQLESQLKSSKARNKLIVTDGVFSMEATHAPLKDIFDLADMYDALVLIDDCHGTGLLGETLRGTEEYQGFEGKAAFINSTFSKALGCSMGGYTVGPSIIMELLRQIHRPYIFTVTLAPSIAASALKTLEMVPTYKPLAERALYNGSRVKAKMEEAGFHCTGDYHSVCPVIIGDMRLARKIEARAYEEGYFLVAVGHPGVKPGTERLRISCTAGHTDEEIDGMTDVVIRSARELGVIPTVDRARSQVV